MTNELYDKIKLIALVLPFITCISAVVTIIGIPYGPQITAIRAAVSTALSDVVLVAKKLYDEKQKENEEESGDE